MKPGARVEVIKEDSFKGCRGNIKEILKGGKYRVLLDGGDAFGNPKGTIPFDADELREITGSKKSELYHDLIVEAE
jgi:hypothetical protein